jgi:hypothetical protein
MDARKVFLMFLIWLAFAVSIACLVIICSDWPKWHGLAARAVETEGRVTAKEPQNHMSIRYSYKVEQQNYTGLGQGGGANPEFEQLSVGDRIKVFYDSANPEISMPGDPQAQSSSIIRAVVFGVIVGPTIGIFSLYRKGWLPISAKARS